MVATGLEQPPESSGNTGVSGSGGADSGALPGDFAPQPAPATAPPDRCYPTVPSGDPDLSAVVAAWPSLPPALRAGIVAMVKAAGAANRTEP